MSDRDFRPLRSIRNTGDGRCLFRSVAYGACLRRGKKSPSDSLQKELADELRAKVADEFVKRRGDTEWACRRQRPTGLQAATANGLAGGGNQACRRRRQGSGKIRAGPAAGRVAGGCGGACWVGDEQAAGDAAEGRADGKTDGWRRTRPGRRPARAAELQSGAAADGFLEGDFESYVSQMRKPHVWGGEPELLMCSHVLRMPITVYIHTNSSGNPRIIAEYGEEYGKDNPVRVLYDGYGHYNALQTSIIRTQSRLRGV